MIDTFSEIYEEFRKKGLEDPLREVLRLADILSGGALRSADASLLAGGLDPREIARRRSRGVPLEYVLGIAPFLGVLFECCPGVFIPRKETELLAITCIEFLRERSLAGERSLEVIETGTGGGVIAVLIALRTDDVTVRASDISPGAIAVAAANVERLGVSDRIELVCGDMFEPFRGRGLEGKVDLVVCNPPYLPSGVVDRLDPSIRRHEPRAAFDAGAYGIDVFRRLIEESPDFLEPGGMLAFELGAGQERIVRWLFGRVGAPYRDITFVDDENGVRVLRAIFDPTRRGSGRSRLDALRSPRSAPARGGPG